MVLTPTGAMCYSVLMANPRVNVRFDPAFYEAMLAHCRTQGRTPANFLRFAAKAAMSKSSHGTLPDALRVRARASGANL